MSASIFRKRHYSWLSSHLRDETHRIKNLNSLSSLIAYQNTIHHLVQALKAENSNFDSDQFFRDCDLKPTPVESIDMTPHALILEHPQH